MRRIDYLQIISDLFQFKSIYDENGNEYVLFANSNLDSVTSILDRTAFEAYENHVHLLGNIKEQDWNQCISISKSLGYALQSALHKSYPNKSFIIFVSIKKNDSMIIRFHQQWNNEAPYFNPDDFLSDFETVIRIDV